MCGIAGFLGTNTTYSKQALKEMTSLLKHRGPDGEGFYFDDFVALGHRRLSIIDLEGGQQPITNEDGSVVTILNGEIYNYIELRQELLKKGHRFSTKTDTECLVHLYEEYGVDFLRFLRGMYALALWDKNLRKLVLARDRVGKKPLYYTVRNGVLIFASELKALKKYPIVDTSISLQSIWDYLTFGFIPSPNTVYKKICKLPPGHLLVYDGKGGVKIERYWHVKFTPKLSVSREEALEQLERSLEKAVCLRLRSDVPVASFLSGGIDSGLVTAIAAQNYPDRIKTFTIGFEDGDFDERNLARKVAERYSTDHHEFLVRPNLEDDLGKIVAAYDEPFADSSAVPSWYVAREAAKHVKVVLNGDGGDEAFCGYRRYLAAKFFSTISFSQSGLIKNTLNYIVDTMPEPTAARSLYGFFHRFLRGVALNEVERYLAWTGDKLNEADKSEMFLSNLVGSVNPSIRIVEDTLNELSISGEKIGFLDRMLWLDMRLILPDDLLVKMDIATMTHSLEARSPFLDHELFEFAIRLPLNIKLPGRTTKPLLRSLAKRYLPHEVVTAPKKGFEVPLARWLKSDLAGMVQDLLISTNAEIYDFLKHKAVVSYIQRTDIEPKRWAGVVWSLLWLELWLRQNKSL
ncbi:MAG: asparagine synthase (glutamine-hydrolyzing) [Firmicutes bacterium]|nr:asparagine synthase (glutamine-hydrolyzing) [Bacillota bacterium]